MATILLHSSKTMRSAIETDATYQAPQLMKKASQLDEYLRTLPVKRLQSAMQLSEKKAIETHKLLTSWTDSSVVQRPAIDAFLGDIYSGFRTHTLTQADRDYANRHLIILSGLYGGLRALDSVYPYRLEMGCKLPDKRYSSLYDFWGDSIAKLIDPNKPLINLSAVEYTKAVLPYLKNTAVISPKFLTVSPKTNEPTFVTVHTKIARGAYAHWIIQNRIESTEALKGFNDLNYRYDASLSSEYEPVFVCKTFGGIGLSVRLS